MKTDVNKKIRVLIKRAKENKGDQDSIKLKVQITDSLATRIKTPEQAKSFMTLLEAL